MYFSGDLTVNNTMLHLFGILNLIENQSKYLLIKYLSLKIKF